MMNVASRLLSHHEVEVLGREIAILVAQGPVPRQGVEVRRRHVDPGPKVLRYRTLPVGPTDSISRCLQALSLHVNHLQLSHL